MRPIPIYGLPRGEYLIGCRPCTVSIDHGFHDRLVKISPREEMVILYRYHESVFYEFDRVSGFIIIKCISSRLKDLESQYFAVTKHEWRNFFRFSAVVRPTVTQKIAAAIEKLGSERDRGKLWRARMEFLLLAYELLLVAKRTVHRIIHGVKTEGVTVLFRIWIRYYIFLVSSKNLSPRLEFPLSMILVKRKVFDRCMDRLECKRLYFRYGDRACCR